MLRTPVAAVAAVAALALLAAPAAAKPKLAAQVSPAEAAAGVKVTVRYQGAAPPARVVVRLGARRLGSAKVTKARGRVQVTIPAGTAAGRHVLRICVRKQCRPVAIRVTGGTPVAPSPTPVATPAATVTASPTVAPPPAVDFTGPANPLEVQAHADDAHAESKVIGMAGGTVSTTKDGVTYTLEVPELALLSDERITLKPIASIDGLPFAGGLAAGVQLEPSGLRFVQPVRLTISGHAPVAPAEETGFLYQHDGDEFQLYPVDADPTKTSFRLLHFSGVGVARGTQAERNAQLLRATRDPEGRLTQELSTIAREAREHALTGNGKPLDVPRLEATLRAYHDQALVGLMAAATTDDNLAIAAINRFLGWERLAYLLAGEDFMLAEREKLQAQMIEIMKNAAIKAHRRCVDEHRPEELPMILSWWRQLSLLGVNEEMPQELFDAVSGCARFELDFATKLRQEAGMGGPEGREVWKGEALLENLIITPDPVTLQQRGTKLAQYLDFRIEVPPHPGGTGCWHGSGEWETTFPFTVSQLEMDLNPIQKPDGSYGYPELDRGDIRLTLAPFGPKEWVFLADCNGTGAPYEQIWLGTTWNELHEDEEGDYGTVIEDWTTTGSGSGSLMGAKTYFRTKTLYGYPTAEETTIELYHAPVG